MRRFQLLKFLNLNWTDISRQVAFVSLAGILCANQALALSYQTSSAAPNNQSTDEEYAVTQAIIINNDEQPRCAVKVTSSARLVPGFLNAPPEGFQTSLLYPELQNCDRTEIEAVRQVAQVAREKTEVAALPAFVAAGVAVCGMTALGGFASGGAAAVGTLSGRVDAAAGGIVGSIEGFNRFKHNWTALRAVYGLSIGAPIGFVCFPAAESLGYKSILFVMESIKN